MKQTRLSSSAQTHSKVLFVIAAGFAASLLLSTTIVGLAVHWTLHN